jgi:hypothetical protein
VVSPWFSPKNDGGSNSWDDDIPFHSQLFLESQNSMVPNHQAVEMFIEIMGSSGAGFRNHPLFSF